jgi:GH15 family glucan-1,4-alpha-glucosidase
MSDLLKISDKQRESWKQEARAIRNYLWKHCFNKDLESFTQYPKSRHQDATNLLFVLLQFLNRHDERTKRIIEQTCKELCTKEVFVSRYLAEDGLQGGEGAFALCSFWLIAALAAVGKYEEALHKYTLLEKHINPQGLISEEIESESGEYLGNYPQAFSHLGLILAAYYLHRYQEN